MARGRWVLKMPVARSPLLVVLLPLLSVTLAW